MAVDTPAHLVIAGFTPLALETALYARFLGYSVTLLGTGRLCSEVQDGPGATKIQRHALTSLGCQAIAAQDGNVDPDEITQNIHTQANWWKQYLEPLAATDLLSDCFLSVDSIDSVQLVDQGGTAATATDADELCTLVFEIGYGLVPTANEEEAGLKKQILSADVLIDVQSENDLNAFDFSNALGVDVQTPTGVTPLMLAWIDDPVNVETQRQRLLTSVDDFYRLGPISLGRKDVSQDELDQDASRIGIEQVRDLFKIIGNRDSLDLYQPMI